MTPLINAAKKHHTEVRYCSRPAGYIKSILNVQMVLIVVGIFYPNSCIIRIFNPIYKSKSKCISPLKITNYI